MAKKTAVVSLGHDALGYTTNEQKTAVENTARTLSDLIEADYSLAITHSNGPQVSMIHKAMTELRRLYPDYTAAPMCVCSAMSQGYVGYDLQNSLKSELLSRGISKNVATLLTQVTVDPYDEAFYEPAKAIGRIMTAEEAAMEERKGNFVKEIPGKGFKRVVAAPQPLDIVELPAIRALLEAGQVVIACGGGGIPVIEQKHVLKGASAVIEKDAIAAKLAVDLGVEELIIFTGVSGVMTAFGTKEEKLIPHMTAAEARVYAEKGEFEEGSMLPKIKAALSFLDNCPHGKVIITSLSEAVDALKGKNGTVIEA